MAVWNGLGVNYKAAQANWDKDIAYFKAIGLKYIRPHMPTVSYPWTIGTSDGVSNYAFWRYLAQYFTQAGFSVTWGPSMLSGVTQGNLTAALWSNYHDSCVAEASYLQSQGIILWDFEVGNEMELFVDGTTLTTTQLRANIRQLATDVKAVYSGTVSYGASLGAGGGHNWALDGTLGGLDTLSIHPYGTVTSASSVTFSNVETLVDSVVTAFGSKAYASEFNVDGLSPNVALLSPSAASAAMQSFLSYLQGTGMPVAIIYMWTGWLNMDNQFAQLYTNGSVNPQWFYFFSSQPMCYTPRVNIAVRIPVPTRINVGVRADVANRTLIYS